MIEIEESEFFEDLVGIESESQSVFTQTPQYYNRISTPLSSSFARPQFQLQPVFATPCFKTSIPMQRPFSHSFFEQNNHKSQPARFTQQNKPRMPPFS